jgi:hypothetical protein
MVVRAATTGPQVPDVLHESGQVTRLNYEPGRAQILIDIDNGSHSRMAILENRNIYFLAAFPGIHAAW